MEKTRTKVIIGLVSALVLCTMAVAPVMANYNFDGWPVETRVSGTVEGGVFTDSAAWTGSTTLTLNSDVPSGTVKYAYLYTGIWGGNPTNDGWVDVTFNGNAGGVFDSDGNEFGPIHLEGGSDTNPNVWCSGYGKYWWYYNVTDLVIPGSTNTATTSEINGTLDGRVYGIVLVVVYEGGDNPKEIQYWINDRSDALNDGNPAGTTGFDGTVDTGSIAGADLEMVHLTGYSPVCTDCLKFNGNTLDTSCVNSNTFEMNTWNVTDYVEDAGNDAWFSHGADPYVNICNAILTVEYEEVVEEPDLIVTDINSYHNNTGCPAWFNVSNEIDVTVKNNGTAPAGASDVSLYIEDVFFGKLSVSGLAADASETVTFENWMPIGDDCLQEPCVFEWSYENYNFTAVADCEGVVAESNEMNNETTVVDRACYNGYIADEPLENVAHGVLHGGLLFTTGDGTYGGLYYPGATKDTNYDITLPDGVELAQLNVYYTWTSPDHACPDIEVRITNATGTYVVPLEKAYNDIKCTCPGASWIKSWGNYVFDLTDYIQGSGTYTVTVENVGSSGHSFCIAAPGIALVYEDETAPLIEYWVNKGADVLMGGRRYPTSSNLAWWECINNATFQASTETGEVVDATLGVVVPWGDSTPDDILFFNEIELGRGVYHGYSSLYSKTIDSLSMYVGASGNAQVGANVTSVTAQYLQGSDNMVSQADDGDNIMACNAFLVVEYAAEEIPVDVRLEPEVLNLNSNGVFTAFISNLSEPYNLTDIDISTVECEGASAVEGMVASDKKYIAKFNTQNLTGVSEGDAVELTVTGMLTTGETFVGSDTICVMAP